ncbi:hypothetical protein NIES2109_48260 [Nostoc sp. HK-01]|nr:hypothetical protein NIES2109_48260 [Nostoc sp. HK-01]
MVDLIFSHYLELSSLFKKAGGREQRVAGVPPVVATAERQKAEGKKFQSCPPWLLYVASRSSNKVTGPSFSISTCIIAPNLPVSTCKPLARNLLTKLLYKFSAV